MQPLLFSPVNFCRPLRGRVIIGEITYEDRVPRATPPLGEIGYLKNNAPAASRKMYAARIYALMIKRADTIGVPLALVHAAY